MESPYGGLGPVLNGLGWLLLCLAFIAVALRLEASRAHRRRFELDDLIMVLSLVFNLLAVVFTTVATHYGLGRRMSDLVSIPGAIPRAGFWGLMADAFCLLGDSVPKLAVALLVNRVLAPRAYLRIFHIVLPLTLITFTVALLIISFAQCTPAAHQWDPKNVPGSCWNPAIFQRMAIADGVLATFTDLYFSIYPPIVISRLHMPMRKKIIAGVLMSLGLLAMFTTAFKTGTGLPQFSKANADITWVLGQVVLWGLLESSITIIAGSVPAWGGWSQRIRGNRFGKIYSWITGHHKAASSMSRDSDGIELDRFAALGARKPSESLDSIAQLARSAAR